MWTVHSLRQFVTSPPSGGPLALMHLHQAVKGGDFDQGSDARSVGSIREHPGDLCDVAEIRAATATQDVEPRHRIDEAAVPVGQFVAVAIVENLCFVQFGMTHARGVAADSANAVCPFGVVGDVTEMIGVSTVHHEVRG